MSNIHENFSKYCLLVVDLWVIFYSLLAESVFYNEHMVLL